MLRPLFRPAISSLVGAMLVVTLLGLAGCAPTNTNTTYGAADIGRTQNVSYGVIVSMRPVIVQSEPTGVGTVAGAVAGATAGSLIGRNDARANVLGAVGGAIVGGVAGTMVEHAASTGTAMEFIIREDNGNTISVVQTNENNFQPGERIVLTRGARTRIARVSS